MNDDTQPIPVERNGYRRRWAAYGILTGPVLMAVGPGFMAHGWGIQHIYRCPWLDAERHESKERIRIWRRRTR